MSNHLFASIRQAIRGDDRDLGVWWAFGIVVFGLYFAAWWMHLRPGVFSYDSGFYLSEVLNGQITSQKPFLYARFIQLTSIGGRAFQITVFVQVALVLLIVSRAFAIAFATRASPVAIALCALLILNPYVANMAFYIQNDVLFCFAIMAMLVETLLVARQGRATTASYLVVALASPMAFGFRDNGLLFLPLWVVLLAFLVRRELWLRLVAVSVTTTALAWSSIAGVAQEDRHSLVYPAVIHEVVRLAQPGYRYPIGGRLSPETRDLVGMDVLKSATPMYWPLYWDTIAFFPGGPQLASLPKESRSAIVRSFVSHDLLPNVPSVAGHRVEMLSGALLARAEYVDPYSAPDNLPRSLKDWKLRVGAGNRGAGPLGKLNDASIRSRAWTWNAAFGIFVLAGLSCAALWRRDKALLLMTALLWVQLAVVLAVAPSAEYRYVFMIYLAPLLMLAGHSQHRPPQATTANPSASGG